MRKVTWTYGLIGGSILALMLLGTIPFQEQIGFDKGAIIGYTSMVLAFLMIFFGVRSYRDEVADGRVTFGRAFGVGLLIMLITTLVYVVTWELVYYLLVPDFIEKYSAYAIAQARAAGATDARIAETSRQMADFAASYRNPLVNIAYTFLEPLPVGLVFALVSAWIVSRPRAKPAGTGGDRPV